MTLEKIITITLLIINAFCAFMMGYFGWDIQLGVWVAFSFFASLRLHQKSLIIKALFFSPFFIYGLVGFSINWHVLPIKIIPLSIACLVFLFKPILKLKYAILSTLILGLASYLSMPAWWNKIENYGNSNNLGKSLPFTVFDLQGLDVTSHFLKSDSLYVFNCWTVNCGVCFRKFEHYKQLPEFYNGRRISFNQLNFPINFKIQSRRDELIKKHFVDLPNYVVQDTSIWNRLRIDGVPLTIILEKGRVIYWGHIPIESKNIAENSLRKELDKLAVNY